LSYNDNPKKRITKYDTKILPRLDEIKQWVNEGLMNWNDGAYKNEIILFFIRVKKGAVPGWRLCFFCILGGRHCNIWRIIY
jgi:hypothetical protein